MKKQIWIVGLCTLALVGCGSNKKSQAAASSSGVLLHGVKVTGSDLNACDENYIQSFNKLYLDAGKISQYVDANNQLTQSTIEHPEAFITDIHLVNSDCNDFVPNYSSINCTASLTSDGSVVTVKVDKIIDACKNAKAIVDRIDGNDKAPDLSFQINADLFSVEVK